MKKIFTGILFVALSLFISACGNSSLNKDGYSELTKSFITLFNKLDQSLCYAYFVFDQPLDALKDKGYYYPSLQYHEPIRSWLIEYARTWGKYLSTPESWNDDCYKAVAECSEFNLDKGWYEDPSNWHSFNDFFHRYLSSPEARPVAARCGTRRAAIHCP